MAWFVKYVCIPLNRLEIRNEGRTAQQRRRSRRSAVLGEGEGERRGREEESERVFVFCLIYPDIRYVPSYTSMYLHTPQTTTIYLHIPAYT